MSATWIILILASFVALGIADPAFANNSELVNDAIHDRLTTDRAELRTDFETTSVDYNATTDILLVDLDYTGSTTLAIPDTDVIVDGEYTDEFNERSVNGSTQTELWPPGQTLHINLTKDNVARFKIVTEGGVAVTREV